jgi:hypothetical protein
LLHSQAEPNEGLNGYNQISGESITGHKSKGGWLMAASYQVT